MEKVLILNTLGTFYCNQLINQLDTAILTTKGCLTKAYATIPKGAMGSGNLPLDDQLRATEPGRIHE